MRDIHGPRPALGSFAAIPFVVSFAAAPEPDATEAATTTPTLIAEQLRKVEELRAAKQRVEVLQADLAELLLAIGNSTAVAALSAARMASSDPALELETEADRHDTTPSSGLRARALTIAERANCNTMACPDGYALKSNAGGTACTGASCTIQKDLLKCCHSESQRLGGV